MYWFADIDQSSWNCADTTANESVRTTSTPRCVEIGQARKEPRDYSMRSVSTRTKRRQMRWEPKCCQNMIDRPASRHGWSTVVVVINWDNNNNKYIEAPSRAWLGERESRATRPGLERQRKKENGNEILIASESLSSRRPLGMSGLERRLAR